VDDDLGDDDDQGGPDGLDGKALDEEGEYSLDHLADRDVADHDLDANDTANMEGSFPYRLREDYTADTDGGLFTVRPGLSEHGGCGGKKCDSGECVSCSRCQAKALSAYAEGSGGALVGSPSSAGTLLPDPAEESDPCQELENFYRMKAARVELLWQVVTASRGMKSLNRTMTDNYPGTELFDGDAEEDAMRELLRERETLRQLWSKMCGPDGACPNSPICRLDPGTF
jgi:hypothetical protein